MFVTLTNASPAFKDQKITINSELIVTMHRNSAIRDDNTIDEVTYLFVPPHGTWEVQETVEQILELLNGN
jgi:hypothetical protein